MVISVSFSGYWVTSVIIVLAYSYYDVTKNKCPLQLIS